MSRINAFRLAIIASLVFVSVGIGLLPSQAQGIPVSSSVDPNQSYSDVRNGLAFAYPHAMAARVWQDTADIPTSLSLQPSARTLSGESSEVGVGLYGDRSHDPLVWLNDHRSTGIGDDRLVAFSQVEILTTTLIAGHQVIFFAHTLFGRLAVSALQVIGEDRLAVVTCTDGCSDPLIRSTFAVVAATLDSSTPRQADAADHSQIQAILDRYARDYGNIPKLVSPDSSVLAATSGYWLPFPTGTGWKVSQGWNVTPSHTGIAQYAYDFAMTEGSSVVAARSGTVIESVSQYTACGGSVLANSANRVVILHDDGTTTLYLHLQHPLVSKGAVVGHGQPIGISGKTGYTDTGSGCGPHLHFQRQQNGIWWTQSQPIYFEEYPGLQLITNNTYTANHGQVLLNPYGFINTPPGTWAGTLNVWGWAKVDGSSISTIQIWVDGVHRADAPYGTAADPNAFEWLWDTTQVSNGTHTVQVRALSANGGQALLQLCGANPCIGGTDLTVNVQNPYGFINTPPGTWAGTLNIWGWAKVDGSSISTIQIWVDGVHRADTTYGTAADPNAFEWLWDTTQVSDGSHMVQVRALSANGGQALLQLCGANPCIGGTNLTVNVQNLTPSTTVTPSPSPTPSTTVTPSPTSMTPSPTSSATVTPSPTSSATVTPSPTSSATVTPSPTSSATVTPSPTPVPSHYSEYLPMIQR